MPKDSGISGTHPKLDPCIFLGAVQFLIDGTQWTGATNDFGFCTGVTGAPFFPVTVDYVGFNTWEFFIIISGQRWHVTLGLDCSADPHDMPASILASTEFPDRVSAWECPHSDMGEGLYVPDDLCNHPISLTVTQV